MLICQPVISPAKAIDVRDRLEALCADRRLGQQNFTHVLVHGKRPPAATTASFDPAKAYAQRRSVASIRMNLVTTFARLTTDGRETGQTGSISSRC